MWVPLSLHFLSSSAIEIAIYVLMNKIQIEMISLISTEWTPLVKWENNLQFNFSSLGNLQNSIWRYCAKISNNPAKLLAGLLETILQSGSLLAGNLMEKLNQLTFLALKHWHSLFVNISIGQPSHAFFVALFSHSRHENDMSPLWSSNVTK